MRTIYFSLLVILFYSCGSENPNESISQPEEKTKLELVPKETFSDGEIDIKMYDFEGLKPLFEQEDNRIHLINFWATWCKPCVAELPFFNQLADKYPEIDLSFVSMDFSTNIESKVLPFLAENELNGRVVVLHEPDANSWIPKIDPDWSGAIPATLIYKKDKREFYEQSFTFEELEKAVINFK